jgi:hypothetical protein
MDDGGGSVSNTSERARARHRDYRFQLNRSSDPGSSARQWEG